MTERTTFTAWITKYALSDGIVRREMKDCPYSLAATEGDEWHRTRAGAIARAEEMRAAAIAAFLKEVARLEDMNFEKSTPT